MLASGIACVGSAISIEGLRLHKRPDPPLSRTMGRDLSQRTVGVRHGHLTNASSLTPVR